MPELDDAKLEELLQMWEQGMPVQDIARELELPITRVRKELVAHGRKRTRSAVHASEAEICTSYAAGDEVSDILAKYELSYSMLYTILSRSGVPVRKTAHKEGKELQLKVAVEMYQAGQPLWQIKQDTGVAQPILHAELHRLKIALRRPRKLKAEMAPVQVHRTGLVGQDAMPGAYKDKED